MYEGECAHMCVCVCVSSVCEFVLDFIWFCVALGIYLPTPRHAAATPPPHPLLLTPCTRTSKKLRLRFFCFFFYIFFFREREKSWFRNSFREFVKRIVLNAFSNNSIELGTRVLPPRTPLTVPSPAVPVSCLYFFFVLLCYFF